MSARRLAARWTVAVALPVAVAVIIGACSGDDASGPAADAGASIGDGAFDLCAAFTHSGDPCAVVSSKPCFPCGVTGGCYCLAGPSGAKWSCVVEDACVPGPGVFGDSGGNDDGDAGVSADAGSLADAGALADADAEAPAEAGADAVADADSDTGPDADVGDAALE